MTADEAIRELLQTSTDVREAAILDAVGTLVAWSPGEVGSGLSAAADALWNAAAARAAALADPPLDHVVVEDFAGAVVIVAAAGRRIVALTSPRPAIGLLLFDLRMCLGDAFAEAVA